MTRHLCTPIVTRTKTLRTDILQIRVFNDGSLYLTNVQLEHAGNYTCHALSNQDVVQTHMLTVYSKFFGQRVRGVEYYRTEWKIRIVVSRFVFCSGKVVRRFLRDFVNICLFQPYLRSR